MTTETPVRAPALLRELAGRLDSARGFSEVVAALQGGDAATLEGVWGSACALTAAALARHAPGPLVVVCPEPGDIDPLCDDLSLFTESASARFPAWETFVDERVLHDEIFGDRLRLLKQLASPEAAPALIVTSIQSLLQGVPSREVLSAGTRTIIVGDECDLDLLCGWLVEQGFHSSSAVELPGEFSRRGGIVDLFAADWSNPVRVELFGDEVESLRRFEVSTQRSLESLNSIELTVLDASPDHREQFASYLPAESWFLLIELGELETEGRRYLDRVENVEQFHSVTAVLKRAYEFPSITAQKIAAGSLDATCRLPLESVERFSGDLAKVRDELDQAGAGQEVYLVVQTEAEAERLDEVFGLSRLSGEGRLHYVVGHLQNGFRLVKDGIALVSGNELFRRAEVVRTARRRLGRVIDSFLELREGDLVVHVAHGIGRYRGMKLLEKGDQVEEHLELEFHGGTRIHVPSSKIELVQKYVGGSKSRPTLARIGGKAWGRQKQLAEQAVVDMAADLLDMQAARASQRGISFATESEWQREFEAAFPYSETPDQRTGIAAIKQDMASTRPMDRLICGDVGYGKTELAMRAAFKAVDNGYQVAVLVPTTVLAAQHYRTFTARMAEFPFQIASLSRFRTRAQQQETIAKLENGEVDIVIGTHRLAQADVQFQNLGLVIIDEEQRFGVEVKERLKLLRRMADVLTLSATPIPRTLHMSLLGLRDISNLETPPEDRLAVETRVTRFEADHVRHAILRELNRGGQIFFVHNRIEDIESVAKRIKQIVPDVRLAIGHGQMPERELERVMLRFVDHKVDLLLATTIIESGLDIPNANTIFIDEADRYGLADMHQLRGRVGRYKHRAYCYLLVDPNKAINPNSARRLRAIEEFSDIGAGFAVAMRDLEIRGAGNLLGTQQSGHINAVGYELYCELLEHAVRELRKMPPKVTIDVNVDLPGEAWLPRDYVSDQRLKIDLYRRLARVASAAELADFREELLDRFGHLPEVVERLIAVMRIRILASGWQVSSIHMDGLDVVLTYSSRPQIERLAKLSGGKLRVVDGRSAYFKLGRSADLSTDAVLQATESLLRAE